MEQRPSTSAKKGKRKTYKLSTGEDVDELLRKMYPNKDLNDLLSETCNSTNLVREEPIEKCRCRYSQEDLGDTVLHVATKMGLSGLMTQLVKLRFLNLNKKNMKGRTALHEAVALRNYKTCRPLLDEKVQVNTSDCEGWTPLMSACSQVLPGETLEIVKELLTRGAKVNEKNHDCWTALHMNCRQGDPDIFKLLLENGADLNMRTQSGQTVFHIAALHNSIEILPLLYEQELRVNFDTPSNFDNYPLHDAVRGNSLQAFKLLLKMGADFKKTNLDKQDIMHLAAAHGHLGLMRFIFRILPDWDVNRQDANKWTALHHASSWDHKDAFLELINHGADSSIKNNKGKDNRHYESTLHSSCYAIDF